MYLLWSSPGSFPRVFHGLLTETVVPSVAMTAMVPRNFSIYWGFGAPIDELDDHDLLLRMAHLKTLARAPQEGFPRAEASWSAPPAASRRPARPRTAPPAGRFSLDAVTAANARPPSAKENSSKQQAVAKQRSGLHVKQMRELAEEAARLERRVKAAGRAAAEHRAQSYKEAQARCARWETKHTQSLRFVQASKAEREGMLKEMLHGRDERLAAWHADQEELARIGNEQKSAACAHATQCFAERVQSRETRLAEAELQVAARHSTMAQMRRAEMARRADEGAPRQLRSLEARAAAEQAQQRRVATAASELTRPKAKQAEARQHQQQRQHEAPRPTSTGGSHFGDSPRYGLPVQTPASRQALGNSHLGTTGLEAPRLQCALCEQQFSSLASATYLKAVGTQRSEFGDDALVKWCEKRGLTKMYESAGLCVFCSQFFAGHWQMT